MFLTGQESVRFDHLSIKDGLSQVSISSIIQDRKGYMWFGTEDGLNRYDGYHFSVFKNDIDNPDSISNNDIKTIYEDSKGLIWVGTKNGLNCYNLQTEKFSRFYFRTKISKTIRKTFLSIVEDKKGILWLGTVNNGLIRFDPKTKKWRTYLNDPDNPNSLGYNVISTLYIDRYNTIWIGTYRRGLDRYNPQTGNFIHYKNKIKNKNSLSHNYVTSIIEDKKGNLLIGTFGGGLNIFDFKSEKFSRYLPQLKKNDYPHHKWIRTIFIDNSGNIWLGTASGGLIKIKSLMNGEIERFSYNPHNRKYSLSGESIDAISEDRSGNIWVGSTTDGINILRNQKQQFLHFSIKYILNLGNSISGFLRDENNVLWYATRVALVKYDKTQVWDKRIKYYFYKQDDPDSLSGSSVSNLYIDHSGNFWVGTNNGLNLFNKNTEKSIRFKNKSENKFSISDNQIVWITEDQDLNLWIGTGAGGINMYKPEINGFTRYINNINKKDSIGSNSISIIFKDPSNKNILWIGTRDSGMDRFDRKLETFQHFRHILGDRNSLSSDKVSSIYIYADSPDIIWVGTYGGGTK